MHNSSHTYTHILAGCWCSPQTNQDSLFLSLPTWRLFCLTSKMGEIKKKRKRWVIYLRVYSFVCVCIVISSQVNIEPGLSLFNRWCYSSVVLFFSLFPSLWNYQKIGWTSSWWWLHFLFLTAYVIIKRRSIIVRLK